MRTHYFNLIAAGCGTGKSYFVCNELLKHYPDVLPNEVLFITSRSLTVQQQSNKEDVIKFTGKETPVIKMWKDFGEPQEIKSGIRIMTYDKVIQVLNMYCMPEKDDLENVKIIIFDECHTLYVDSFMNNMNMLRLWIRLKLESTDKIFFGLTATPEIVRANEEISGIFVNELTDNLLINYRAKKLICTDNRSIGYLLNNQLNNGKTLVMCNSVKNAIDLKSRVNNAAMLVSKNNNLCTDEMIRIRNYIAENEMLPPTFIDDDGTEKELKILITTSTAREGYNLREASGVKNIVSFFSDSMNITQIAGRARYDIDNLVVVKHRLVRTNQISLKTIDNERILFYNFMNDTSDDSWFRTIQHLVQHDFKEVKIITSAGDKNLLLDLVERKWVLDNNASWEEIKNHRIWRQEDKDELTNVAIKSRVIDKQKRNIKFNTVLRFLENQYGYKVVNKVFSIQGKQVRCKLIYRG